MTGEARWSELPAWRRRAELAKVHPDLTEDDLIADGLDVPELRPQIEAQETQEDKLMVVLRYFGDEERPQPKDRTDWVEGIIVYGVPMVTSRTPDWGRLPRLDGATAASPRRKMLPRQRPSDELEKQAVSKAIGLLDERAAILEAGASTPPELTLESIGRRAGLGSGKSPDRVASDRAAQIRDLLAVGWDPLITHPEFSVQDGFVRMPRPAEARRLLGLGALRAETR